jgi:hypothetical protein
MINFRSVSEIPTELSMRPPLAANGVTIPPNYVMALTILQTPSQATALLWLTIVARTRLFPLKKLSNLFV